MDYFWWYVIYIFTFLMFLVLIFHKVMKNRRNRKFLLEFTPSPSTSPPSQKTLTTEEFRNIIFERLYVLNNQPVEGTSTTIAQWFKVGDVITNVSGNGGRLGSSLGCQWDETAETFTLLRNAEISGIWLSNQPSNLFNVIFGAGPNPNFGSGIPTPRFNFLGSQVNNTTVYDLKSINFDLEENIYILFGENI